MRQKMPRRGTLRNGTDRILQHFHIFVWTDSLGLSRLSALLVITALPHLMSILLALDLSAIFLTIPNFTEESKPPCWQTSGQHGGVKCLKGTVLT